MADQSDRLGIWGLLETQAKTRADKPCVIVEAEKTAQMLNRLGVQKGDRVGMLLPTSDAWFYAFWGIQRIGAEAVLLAPGTGRDEVANVFALTGVKVCFAISRFQANSFVQMFRTLLPALPALTHLIVDGEDTEDDFVVDFRKALNAPPTGDVREPAVIFPDDIYALMSTSGTAGTPKIIPKRHASNVAWLWAYNAFFGLKEDDVLFSTLPPFHMLSLSHVLLSVVKGATSVYLSFFDPDEVEQTLLRFQVTLVLLSATHAKMWMATAGFENADLSSVDRFLFSGEFLPDEIAAEFYDKRSFRVLNVIGSTEVSAYLGWDSARDRGHSVSVLTPLSFAEIKLLNENGEPCGVGEKGEIFVTHGDMLSEYYRNPEASSLSIVASTTGKNWFRTGDLAILRQDGRYQFAGRLKRVIKRGAVLIYPEEIECFLLTHPDIQAAAILNEEDPLLGETMKAFIELRPGAALSVIDIVRFCQGRLANYKIPEKIVIMDELPRETGKVQLKKLKEA